MSYSVRDYAGIIGDAPRINAYREAMRRHITPNSVVLDLGAGTGIFSLIACELGAHHVYAVESNPAIRLGSTLARENDYEKKITFIEQDSRTVELPEKVDLIVSDIRGVLPLHGDSLGVVSDAVDRFLKNDGVILPHTDTLQAAIIQSKSIYNNAVMPYGEEHYGCNLEAIKKTLIHTWQRTSLTDEDLISEINLFYEIDYTKTLSNDLSTDFSLRISQDGTAYGFCVWFNTTLTEDIGYKNGPGAEVSCYDTAFFPFEEGVSVVQGDTVTIDLKAKLVGDEHVWRWNTDIESSNGTYRFQQTTFNSDLFTKKSVKGVEV